MDRRAAKTDTAGLAPSALHRGARRPLLGGSSERGQQDRGLGVHRASGCGRSGRNSGRSCSAVQVPGEHCAGSSRPRCGRAASSGSSSRACVYPTRLSKPRKPHVARGPCSLLAAPGSSLVLEDERVWPPHFRHLLRGPRGGRGQGCAPLPPQTSFWWGAKRGFSRSLRDSGQPHAADTPQAHSALGATNAEQPEGRRGSPGVARPDLGAV